ncbi:MAG: hypothetical protein CME61_05385 [Halobacteriovoraceae bacterium]|nr:hypothetical protein [Halobacteriovoraceae bacterium]
MSKLVGSISLIFFLVSCSFNSTNYEQIVFAQKEINQQNYLSAKERLERVLSSHLSLELRAKVLHQVGVLNAFHLDNVKDGLKSFKLVLELPLEENKKRKSLLFLADLYFSKLRDFKNSELLYRKLLNFEKDGHFDQFLYFRYIKSIFEQGKFKEVENEYRLNEEKFSSFKFRIISTLSICFLKKTNDCEKKLNDLKRDNLTPSQVTEVNFFLANLFEENGDLEKSYKTYSRLISTHPNPNLIKFRLDKIVERKKAEKR